MLLRLLLVAAASVPFSWAAEDAPYDPLSAHGGMFKALPWRPEELEVVSILHATAEYHKLLRLIARKLVESDIEPRARKQIEKFLMERKPPRFMETFYSDAEKYKIQNYKVDDGKFSDEDLDYMGEMLKNAYNRLTPDQQEKAAAYFQSSRKR